MQLNKFESLIQVMDELREKCPWDKKQTFDSIKSNTIEECYELIEAIGDKDFDNIKEELGDILLQVVFYSKMADEKGEFDIYDVIEGLNNKLIGRHPHVFGDTDVKGVEDVLRNWEDIKRTEGKKTVLGGVPSALPAMIKAYRVQSKAAAVGFDWEYPKEAWEKVKEEVAEFEVELEAGDKDKMKQEFGDIMFAMINSARKLGFDPEEALELSNRKFISRFNYIERSLDGKMRDASLDAMEELWNEAKLIENSNK